MAAEGQAESFSYMSEEILDKLYLLGYDSTFLKDRSSFKPLMPDYFAIQLNANEQFNYFKALVKWLFALNDIQSQDFDTYNDPNTVAQNMQFEMRKLGVNLDVIASKIKQGSGEHVCEILLGLCDATLAKKRISLKQPQYPRGDDGKRMERDIGDEDDDSVDYEGAGVEDEDGDEIGVVGEANADNKKVIESKANEKEWRNECERVKKHLENISSLDQKEWRHHIERSKELSEKIQTDKPKVQTSLEKLADLLEKHLDRIGSREKEINKVMVEIGEEFKTKSERYKELQGEIDHLSVKVKKLNEEYSQLSVKNEQLQAKLNKQADESTNNQPLIQIKETIQQVKKEIQAMDVRIGVLNNIVWRHNFETRKQVLDETIGNKGRNERDLYLIAEAPDMDNLEDEDAD